MGRGGEGERGEGRGGEEERETSHACHLNSVATCGPVYCEMFAGKESEDIHIPGIDVGGGWRIGCGSHPPSADRAGGRTGRECLECCATGE